MKRRYIVSRETGYNPESGPVKSEIKTFKNQPEALAFYSSARNIRRYGTLYLTMQDADGHTYNWDDRKAAWE